MANQYHNPINPQSHALTTGPEIWEQTDGEVTDVAIGMGTGGTISGVARYMRENSHDVQIIGVDPKGSLLYDAWKAGGVMDGLEASSYKIEGIGEDFILTTLDLSLVDSVVQVDDAEAFHWTRRLVREEGIFCGGSSGAAMAGAVKAAKDLGLSDMTTGPGAVAPAVPRRQLRQRSWLRRLWSRRPAQSGYGV